MSQEFKQWASTRGKKSLQLGVKTEYSNRSLESGWELRAHAAPGGRGRWVAMRPGALHTLNTYMMNQPHRELAGAVSTVPLSSNIQPLPLQSQPQNSMFVQTTWEMLNRAERKYRQSALGSASSGLKSCTFHFLNMTLGKLVLSKSQCSYLYDGRVGCPRLGVKDEMATLVVFQDSLCLPATRVITNNGVICSKMCPVWKQTGLLVDFLHPPLCTRKKREIWQDLCWHGLQAGIPTSATQMDSVWSQAICTSSRPCISGGAMG